MIRLLLTRSSAYTVETCLQTADNGLHGVLEALPYEVLFRRRTVAPGTYVFTDMERLAPRGLERAGRIWETLASEPDAVRVLNPPRRVLSRYDLLQRLHAEGVNDFRAFRADDLPATLRWPVFLRVENDHKGHRSNPIENEADLHAAIAGLTGSGRARAELGLHGRRKALEDVIVVELCDTADEAGVYRKYSAFLVGGTVIARHVFFGRDWMIKKPSLVEDRFLEEELAYVRTNPHEAELRRIFDLGGVEYGRVDYAVDGERLRVWEINTNPMIMTPEDLDTGVRATGQALFKQRFRAALQAIDRPSDGAPISLPAWRRGRGPVGWVRSLLGRGGR